MTVNRKFVGFQSRVIIRWLKGHRLIAATSRFNARWLLQVLDIALFLILMFLLICLITYTSVEKYIITSMRFWIIWIIQPFMLFEIWAQRMFAEFSVRCIFAIENDSIHVNQPPPDLRRRHMLFGCSQLVRWQTPKCMTSAGVLWNVNSTLINFTCSWIYRSSAAYEDVRLIWL